MADLAAFRRRSAVLATTLAAALLLPLRAQADGDAALHAAVDAAIRPLMAAYGVPGVAVAVTVDGKASFFNYGLASKEAATPVSEHTLFELGSVSKTFTATLFAYAQLQGKVALDDHPSQYLPALKGYPIDQATLLNLGTYTAGGLPLQFPDEVGDQTMLAYYQQWQPAAAPGAVREYSNPSLGLFGHVAALALKADFGAVMEQRIFAGFGLKHTYVNVPDSAMSTYAWGYRKGQPIRMKPDVLWAPTYGVRSTTEDLIRYVQANIAPQQLDDAMRRAVEGTHVGYFRVGGMVQGLGWEQYAWPVALPALLAGNADAMIRQPAPAQRLAAPQPASAATLFDKTGSTNGFGAYIAFVPSRKIGVVILANQNYPIAARVQAGHAILEQLSAAAMP